MLRHWFPIRPVLHKRSMPDQENLEEVTRAVLEVVAQPRQEDEDEAQADEGQDRRPLAPPSGPSAGGLLGAGVYRDSEILKRGGRASSALPPGRSGSGENT